MTLVVCHASADVDKHVAALKRVRRFRIACLPQRAASPRRPAAADAVLWELAPGQKPNWRRISAIARGTPVVSYSVDTGRELADLSRATGFVSHLKAPLRPVEVEQQLALASPVDLATRLRQFQSTLRRHLGRADVLAEMMRAVHASLEPPRVADAVLARVASWLPVPSWAVASGDVASGATLIADRGGATDHDEAVRAVAAWVLRHGGEFATANLRDERGIAAGPAVAAVGFPLVCRGRAIGVLVGLDRRPSARTPRLAAATLAALRTLLEPAAIALDDALRVQRAEALSVTDDLTQLYNSRYLTQVLRRETKRASRSGRPLSLLFVDLDGFKSINDAHGHLSGSRALVEAAQVIKSSARETDMVARFGGDEFALVLPDTGSEGAEAVGERVRDRIAAHRFLAGDGLHIGLTASVGVATLPDVAASAEGLIQAADQAMYWVKAHGKNGIFLAT